jgi:hypothetical protein
VTEENQQLGIVEAKKKTPNIVDRYKHTWEGGEEIAHTER